MVSFSIEVIGKKRERAEAKDSELVLYFIIDIDFISIPILPKDTNYLVTIFRVDFCRFLRNKTFISLL